MADPAGDADDPTPASASVPRDRLPLRDLRAGDRVRLTCAQQEVAAGEVGQIIGFYRQDPEVLVVKFDRCSSSVRVAPDDVQPL